VDSPSDAYKGYDKNNGHNSVGDIYGVAVEALEVLGVFFEMALNAEYLDE